MTTTNTAKLTQQMKRACTNLAQVEESVFAGECICSLFTAEDLDGPTIGHGRISAAGKN